MKQKTEMQILIDELEVDAKNANGFYSNHEICIIKNIISYATRLLTTEMEQIEEAYNQGHDDAADVLIAKNKSASDYYQQKYGDEPTIKND